MANTAVSQVIMLSPAALCCAVPCCAENGKYPIVVDTSPCLSQIKSALSEPTLR
jgi:hypothetical protein